jgi:S-DNA-T family DNA segregation ATPase FtsK/SpoIIIE
MAEKKTSTKKKTGSASTAKSSSRSGTKKSVAAKESTRAARVPEEELESGHSGAFWGVVLLALGIFMIISYFSNDGKVVAFFANLVKGLVGWGFWLTVPAFLYAGVILLFEREHPVGHRVTCALLLPTIFAGMAELIHPAEVDIFSRIQTPVRHLYSTGKMMDSAGVLGGYLGKLLVRAFSIYGAFPFLLVLFILFAVIALRGTLVGSLSGVKKAAARQREVYRENREREMEPEEMDEPVRRPEKRSAPAARETASRSRRPAYSMDIPLGSDEDEEVLSLRGPSRTSRTESAPKKTPVRRKAEESRCRRWIPSRSPSRRIRSRSRRRRAIPCCRRRRRYRRSR